MNRFRSVLFWAHFACGTIAGVFIAVMCVTGTLLAFEKSIADFVDRESVRVAPPPDHSSPLGIREILRRVRDQNDDARPTAVTVSSDPAVAVRVDLGRDGTVFANPYSGEIHSANASVRSFFNAVEDWHRALALGGDRRPIGRAITGAGNAAFLILALSGIYLWMPRRWSWSAFRSAISLRWRLAGRARDFNWHTTVGIWASPILVVLTLTALPMSYRWANDALYHLVGSTPPAAPTAESTPTIVPPSPDTRPLDPDALITVAKTAVPGWETITLRLRNARRPEGSATGAPREVSRRGESARGGNSRATTAAGLSVRAAHRWPLFSSVMLSVNPYTGEILQQSDFATTETGRRWRSWARFLHTGEAFGLPGQMVAAAGTLGGIVLVVTGVALACRRVFGRRQQTVP
ncbi:MAG TPA: PepSY-associated TM helix domain-containing protein [Candidatus Didemnitutus sp.]|nr:PepSY-associated TM helix domain-containing protein [Candidatus Didemnitutus sp.]